MAIEEGDKAPGFDMETDGGGQVSLQGLKGRPVVLYFYPKDDTPGCTKEACGFRDMLPDFKGVDAEIIGVSKDSPAKHDKFKAKYDLPFTLASDADGSVCEAYGTWIEKSMYGKKYMGIDRATFLIDGDGVVRKVWRKVKVPGPCRGGAGGRQGAVVLPAPADHAHGARGALPRWRPTRQPKSPSAQKPRPGGGLGLIGPWVRRRPCTVRAGRRGRRSCRPRMCRGGGSPVARPAVSRCCTHWPTSS